MLISYLYLLNWVFYKLSISNTKKSYSQISCGADPKQIQFIPKKSRPLKIILVSIATINGDTSDDLGTFGKFETNSIYIDCR